MSRQSNKYYEFYSNITRSHHKEEGLDELAAQVSLAAPSKRLSSRSFWGCPEVIRKQGFAPAQTRGKR